MAIAFTQASSYSARMKMVRWKRFTWDLAKLPSSHTALPAHFQVRGAGREDHKAAREVIIRAFLLDPAWSDVLKTFSPKLEAQLETAFARPAPNAVVVSHGQRIIAASLLSLEPDAESHFLSGPCVYSEYRSRGIGTALLYHSLKVLQTGGLPRAHAICKEMAAASKFVYKKFDSTAEPFDFDRSLVGSH